MADMKGESPKLTLKRMEQRLAEMVYQLSRTDVRKLELEREQELIEENEKASREAMEKLQSEISEFKKTL